MYSVFEKETTKSPMARGVVEKLIKLDVMNERNSEMTFICLCQIFTCSRLGDHGTVSLLSQLINIETSTGLVALDA